MPKNNTPVFRANGNIGPSLFVKIDTTADHMLLQAGSGDQPIGISQVGMKRTPGLAGSDTTIAAAQGDVCQITAGAAVTRGDLLKADASGRGITAGSGDLCGAVALESASGVGVLIECQIIHRKG